MIKVLNILMAIKMMILSDLYALFYLRWVDSWNILIMMEKNMSFKIEDDTVLVEYIEIEKKLKRYYT